MSNRVITCKITKEIRDALEIQCQGTKEIKKNRRAILIQEYEYFEAKFDDFLGLQIKQTDDRIFINHSKYTKNLLKRFNILDSSSASTPMATATKLDQHQGDEVDVTSYRGMIRSLLYLTTSRPDIMYATCLCARFQAQPREPHLIAVKRIFKYLKGNPDIGLWYPRESDFNLIGYSDAEFAGCKVDRKSITKDCIIESITKSIDCICKCFQLYLLLGDYITDCIASTRKC